MDYHEFTCAGASAVVVVTAYPDPDRIPLAAQRCCRRWVFAATFHLGDGTHSLALDATIKLRVESEGYHLYVRRACQPTGQPAA